MMIEYANLSGASGVTHYMCVGTYEIHVRFIGGKTYVYSLKAGPFRVAAMQEYGQAGRGLNTYINQWAKYEYDYHY